MSLSYAIGRFRAKQESVFTDACVVKRSSGPAAVNPTTLELTPASTTTVYSGPCLIRHTTAADPAVAGVATDVATHLVKFPADTPVTDGDIVEVASSTYDADLTGEALTVRSVPLNGWQIARLAYCELQR